MATRPPVRLARRQAYRNALRISGLSSTTTRKTRSSARTGCSLTLMIGSLPLQTPHDRAAQPAGEHCHENRPQAVERAVVARPSRQLGAESNLADRKRPRYRGDDPAVAQQIGLHL